MNIRTSNFLISALALGASLSAHAQFYAGGSVGRSDISVDGNQKSNEFLDLGFNGATTTTSDNDTAYRLFGGYMFNPYLSVEAAYVDFGRFDFQTVVDPAGSLTGKPKINGGELSIVGRFPIGDQFAVYGRAGLFYARTRTTYTADGSVELITGSESQRKNSTKGAYALGASYAFTSNVSLRAEWARYTGLGDDLVGFRSSANLISIGAVYSF
jgi:OmpA-OmpF porin, OOP family